MEEPKRRYMSKLIVNVEANTEDFTKKMKSAKEAVEDVTEAVKTLNREKADIFVVYTPCNLTEEQRNKTKESLRKELGDDVSIVVLPTGFEMVRLSK